MVVKVMILYFTFGSSLLGNFALCFLIYNSHFNTLEMKTLKFWQAIVLVTVLALVITSCNKDDDEIQLDFDVTVPGDWTQVTYDDDVYLFYAQSPLENSEDSIREDMLVTREQFSGITLPLFYTAVIAGYDSDTTFHLLSSVDTTINGIDSKKVVHNQTLYIVTSIDTVELKVKALKYLFARNNYGYLVSFSALQSTYDIYEPVFENIIASFEFKN
jgi:hypothetical protein